MADNLWIDAPDDIANAPAVRERPRRTTTKKAATTFARIPHDRGLKLAKHISSPALAVLLALDYAIYRTHSNRIKLTNGLLNRYEISHQSKNRGLRQLGATGVITVERRGKREAPVVTHHWYTKYGKFKWSK